MLSIYFNVNRELTQEVVDQDLAGDREETAFAVELLSVPQLRCDIPRRLAELAVCRPKAHASKLGNRDFGLP